MTTKPEISHSEQQAIAQLESIREMVAALEDQPCAKCNGTGSIEGDVEASRDEDCPDCNGTGTIEADQDEAQQTISEDALSVEVRSGWYCPGARDADTKPAEFTILLCTGGPACRIIGSLSEHGEPESARIEHQDWFTPWTEYRISVEDEDIVLTYCRQFYFGD